MLYFTEFHNLLKQWQPRVQWIMPILGIARQIDPPSDISAVNITLYILPGNIDQVVTREMVRQVPGQVQGSLVRNDDHVPINA